MFPASNFHLPGMSIGCCVVASGAPGAGGPLFWVTFLCNGAPETGVQVTLCAQVTTCVQLR